MCEEGVIKFDARHEMRRLNDTRFGTLACQLIAWREILAKTQLVGQDPARYDGAGYGNVSGRIGPPSASRGERTFLISGTQTGGNACMSLDDFCVVSQYNYHKNQVKSYGSILPSSESMTHAAIYDLAPSIRFVLHAHTPTIWKRSKELRIPTTDPSIPYGTRKMAFAVQTLFRTTALSEKRILSMGGHEDGIIVFGKNLEEAGQVLLSYLARAYERECIGQGLGLCSR